MEKRTYLNMAEIGRRLFMYRTSLRLSQFDVAELSNVSVRTYADIERGETNMRVSTLLSVCAALKITPNDVLLRPEEENEFGFQELLSELASSDERVKKTACRIIDALIHF